MRGRPRPHLGSVPFRMRARTPAHRAAGEVPAGARTSPSAPGFRAVPHAGGDARAPCRGRGSRRCADARVRTWAPCRSECGRGRPRTVPRARFPAGARTSPSAPGLRAGPDAGEDARAPCRGRGSRRCADVRVRTGLRAVPHAGGDARAPCRGRGSRRCADVPVRTWVPCRSACGRGRPRTAAVRASRRLRGRSCEPVRALAVRRWRRGRTRRRPGWGAGSQQMPTRRVLGRRPTLRVAGWTPHRSVRA